MGVCYIDFELMNATNEKPTEITNKKLSPIDL